MKRISILFITTLLLAFAIQVFAADFTVNMTTDQHDANRFDGICDIDLGTAGEQCTLRAATEQTVYTSYPLHHRVFFNLPADSIVTLTAANGGELNVNYVGSMQIIGTGADNLTIDGGAGDNRILKTYNTEFIISGVTLTGGNGADSNSTGNGGGAIFAGGPLTLDRVHVTSNSAPNSVGGGVLFISNGAFRVTNSTFSKNSAGFGGGIWHAFGTLTMYNSTISDNTVKNYGGGFWSSANATFRNVTITNNTAETVGGGIFSDNGTLDLGNTIVAGNIALFGAASDIRFQDDAVITSAGYNLIGDSPGDSTNTFKPIAYQPTDFRDVNPMLGALQNNGGTTPTRALLAGSAAINAGSNPLSVVPSTAAQTDQRGFARIVGGTVDIGAYEFAPAKALRRVIFF